MYKIKRYSELTAAQTTKFWRVLQQQASCDTSPAMVNMHSDNWAEDKHTLRYLLDIEKKFAASEYYILYHGANPVASGGVYLSEWTTDIAMAGIRTWVHTEYRNRFLAAEYILPACKAWAIANKCKIVTLTFNEYNRRLITTWRRVRAGESAQRIKNRTRDKLFYSGVIELDKPIKINYTKQWVIYEQLEPMTFNWSELTWRDKIKLVHRKLG